MWAYLPAKIQTQLKDSFLVNLTPLFFVNRLYINLNNSFVCVDQSATYIYEACSGVYTCIYRTRAILEMHFRPIKWILDKYKHQTIYTYTYTPIYKYRYICIYIKYFFITTNIAKMALIQRALNASDRAIVKGLQVGCVLNYY